MVHGMRYGECWPLNNNKENMRFFFLVISLQLVEFGEGRFERKAEQF